MKLLLHDLIINTRVVVPLKQNILGQLIDKLLLLEQKVIDETCVDTVTLRPIEVNALHVAQDLDMA